MAEVFSLQWNEFQSNISNSFTNFRNEDYLNDVTLVTDDQQQISAHKLVLSSSSDYFRTIFKKNNNSTNMLICFEGVGFQELSSCLDYMYNGEVQISQDILDRFLNVAQRLKIKGLLTDKTSENVKTECESNSEILENKQGQDIFESSDNAVDMEPKEPNIKDRVTFEGNAGYDMITETNKYIEKLEEGDYKCTVCGKLYTGADKEYWRKLESIRNHVETHIEGLEYFCSFCSKVCKSKNALRCHKYKFHKN